MTRTNRGASASASRRFFTSCKASDVGGCSSNGSDASCNGSDASCNGWYQSSASVFLKASSKNSNKNNKKTKLISIFTYLCFEYT